jgi:putative FmdB family regulatory protein
MPIYEYQCAVCRHEFERLQKISEEPVKICPECGKEEVDKLVSKSGFVLKGGGWYKDHYGLKASDSSSSSSGDDSGESGSSDSGSSDSGSSDSGSSDSGSSDSSSSESNSSESASD